MSTEHQKYSIEQQHVQLRAYSDARGYRLVATYTDEGKSGLSLRGRPALQELIKAVVSGGATFTRVLVLDVSRWGRFQDPDEAAHLEFICREAGIPVEYVAEPFNEWTGAAVAVVKSIKRIMAAEYSRELSARVKSAQLLHAKQGYKQGGRAPFGTRRLVIDYEGVPRGELHLGERKHLSSDKVTFIRGPAREDAVIKRIFNEFVTQGVPIATISRRLNRGQVGGRVWTVKRVAAVLDAPHVQGVHRYNVSTSILGSPRRLNARSEWIETQFASPLLPEGIHEMALAKRKARRRRVWTDNQLIDGLKVLREQTGKLTSSGIGACRNIPSLHTYIRRFGSLEAAYALAGYVAKKQTARPKHQTDEHLLAGLHRILAENGRLSGALIDADPSLPSVRSLRRRFGSLENVLEFAGYGLAERAAAMSQRIKRRRPRTKARLTTSALIAPLKRLYAERGYLSREMIEADARCASLPTYVDRFGSILIAYQLAGWTVTRGEICSVNLQRQRRGNAPVGGWTRANVEQALVEALEKYGRLTSKIIALDPQLPNPTTVAYRFGGLRAAYAAIGFDPNHVE